MSYILYLAELRVLTKDMPGDTVILLSSDPEGNKIAAAHREYEFAKVEEDFRGNEEVELDGECSEEEATAIVLYPVR